MAISFLMLYYTKSKIMNSSSFKKNKLLAKVLILTFILTPIFYLFPIKNVRAQVEVEDLALIGEFSYFLDYLISVFSGTTPSVFNGEVLTEDTNLVSRKNIGKYALKMILRQLTVKIVEWIDSGFAGNPSFITDTGQFLQDTADITIGDFIMNDPALNFLCDPFKIQIKLALGLQYRPFKDQIECRFTDALGNVNDAMNGFLEGDFIGGGGWDSWLQMTTVPQNNQMGAMMLAQGELDARIETNKNIQLTEANWGGGFMSWKECTNSDGQTVNSLGGLDTENTNTVNADGTFTYANAGPSNTTCTIQTPGGLIANKINWMDTSTIRELELADDVNAIFNALMNQLIEVGMGALSEGGLLGSNSRRENNSHEELMSYLDQLETQTSNSSSNTNSETNTPTEFRSDITSSAFVNKNTSLQIIDTQIAIEDQYLEAQNNILVLLDTAENIFASSTCSEFTRNYLVSQITGIYTGQKDLIWNKIDINHVINLTNNNIAILSTAEQQINSANTNTEIQNIVGPLSNLTTLHSSTSYTIYSEGGTTFNSIMNWLVNNINTNISCVGNISDLAVWGIQ
jgi:hypothetical protein